MFLLRCYAYSDLTLALLVFIIFCMYSITAGYRQLYASGELARRAELLQDILSCCTLCPWKCRVNRAKGELGRCKASAELKRCQSAGSLWRRAGIVRHAGLGNDFFLALPSQLLFLPELPDQPGRDRRNSFCGSAGAENAFFAGAGVSQY